MKRRAFLALPAATLAACGESDEMAQPNFQNLLSPWHMWGTSGRVIVAHPSSNALQFQQSKQLAKIAYARPETWTFLFGAVIIKAPDAGMNPVNIIVDYDVYAGIGRSMLRMQEAQGGLGLPGFARFVFSYTTPGVAVIGKTKWTTVTQGPILDESAVTPVQENLDSFPAQDIQASARVSTVAVDAQDAETIVEVHTYFAPKTHIRPDWYQKDINARFRGGEQGGT